MIGVLLCSLVMFLFLHTLSATFVTVITIPICIMASFFVIRSFGITINNMTMMGISLAVGMVVDATTVVLENIHRHLEAGEKPLLAASSGTSEVSFAILAGAATTIAVFAPIANMGGMMGRIFFAFGVTIVTTIGLSLILSLTLTPFLCSRMLRTAPPGRIGALIERGFGRLEDAYGKTLEFAVRHRKTVLTAAFGVFALGIFFVAIMGTGFMPTEDRGDFTIDFEMPNNFSITQSEETAAKIEKTVRNNQAVDYTLTSLGSGTGEEVYKGTMSVYLFDKSARAPISEVMSQIREALSIFRDVDYTLADFGGADTTLTLVGSDTHKIAAVADRMVADLKTDGRLVDIKTDLRLNKPRINISINRGLADSMGVDIRKLSEEVQAYFSGTKAGVFKDGGYRYDIRLQAADFLRRTISDIERIPIRNGNGDLVNIPDIVAISEGAGAEKIMRYNRQLSLTISANTTGNLSTGEGVAMTRESFNRNAPEDGSVSILVTGSSERMADSFNSLISAIAMAVILVYMVMAVQFESFIHPLTVMFSLPLMTAGAFGSLLLAGLQLDTMALIGIILLVGIVVNNAIILVDFINQERASGIDKTTAVLRAGPLRLRPILMTALSTMVGALPVALGLSTGAEIRQPMSVALIGGLFTSTLLTLIVIPTAYLVVDDARDRAGIIFRFLRRRLRRTTQEPNPGYSGGSR
jgi:HAE1 family hydrophobic/amphiphilic exporter-1